MQKDAFWVLQFYLGQKFAAKTGSGFFFVSLAS
jgi:hypothetical protein